MEKGFIKLYRKVFNKYYFKENKDAFYLFIYLVSRCNYEPTVVRGTELEAGQFKTSLDHIKDDTFIDKSKIRRILKTLVKKRMIKVKSLGRNGTIITVVNYSIYQKKAEDNCQQLDANCQQLDANCQQLDANCQQLGSKCQQRDTKTDTKTDTKSDTIYSSNNRTQSEIATQKVTQKPTQKPTLEKKKRSKEINNNIYSRIKDAFNDTCSSLPKCTKITDQRKRMIDARLKDYTVDDFETVFELAQASDFLSGRNKQWTNCNFDWLIKPNNFVKVIERTYNTNKHNKEHRKGFLSG